MKFHGKAPASKWPERPYRGFSFYTREDTALLAGRVRHVEDCSRLLALKDTRILFLHGTTGSGKSSFLRAGLIPFLEHEVGSFDFLNEENNKALFIRSFEDPLWSLARKVHEMAGVTVEIPSPRGGIAVRSLEAARLGIGNVDAFAELVNSKPVTLVESLQIVSSTLPATLVLIIDQGEEVLTLKPGADGDKDRQNFFEFLWEFGQARLDMKILIAIRTEYYGRFQSLIRRDAFDADLVRDYLLPELGRADLIDAISRPTSKEQVVDGIGPPYRHFKFSFEPGLPGKIADDLLTSNLAGGVLPALQIVCDRLWESTRTLNHEWTITSADYESLGGVEGQIEQQIVESLMECARKSGILNTRIVNEAVRWVHVLGMIAKTQVDGTSTTERQRAEDLERAAKSAGCRVPFAEMMAYLSDEERRIVRSEEVRTRGNETITCYTLGHDAVGLVLNKWKVALADIQSHMHRSSGFMIVAGISLCIAGLGFQISGFDSVVVTLSAAYGVTFIVFGLFAASRNYSIFYSDGAVKLQRWLSVLPGLGKLYSEDQFSKDPFFRALMQIHAASETRSSSKLQ